MFERISFDSKTCFEMWTQSACCKGQLDKNDHLNHHKFKFASLANARGNKQKERKKEKNERKKKERKKELRKKGRIK